MLDNFLKDYDKEIYKRQPKSKVTIRVIYAVLIVALIMGVVRAIILFNK
jgi:hypothetical protein